MSCSCKKAVNIFESASTPYRIGKTGENVYQEIEFDFSKWLSKYPDAKIDLLIRVPKNGFYLLAEGITESTYLWKPSAFDLANPGMAAVMARMSSGEVRAKSDPIPFEIVRSMDYNLDISEPGPARPSLMDEWIEDIYEAAARYPKIGEDNYWYVWDVVEGDWKKTDTYAGGTEGKGSIVYVTIDENSKTSMSASEIIAAVNAGKFPIMDMLGVYIPYSATNNQGKPIFAKTAAGTDNTGIQTITVTVYEDRTWTWEFTDSPTKSEAVLYTQQSPTPAQQEQARENIGAAAADDVASDFAARDSLMQKCTIVVDSSPNRWNKDAASNGLLGLDGRLYTGGSYDNYCYYNIGSVREGDVITSYKKQNAAVDSATMMRVVCYDSGGNAVVSAGTSTATQSFTVPSGVASVAICTTKNTGLTYNYMVLANAESAPIDYIPYSESNSYYVATEDFLPKSMRTDKVKSLLGSDSPSVSVDTLASGTTLTLTDAPYFIKKNVTVSARMEFETFTSVEIGKGQNSYRGKSVVVDGTNITQVSYNDSGTPVNGNSVAHGLTVSDYLQVAMHLGDDGKCAVTVNTTSGTFDTVFDFSAEWNYSPFVVGAQTMTDVQLGYSCSDIRCPMWIFGDSYLGLWDNRVGGQLRNLGFFNVALIGVAGGRANDGSKATYPDLQRMLALGTPKYIIWTLGMNGGDNANIAFLPTLVKLCENKDIELILYKVPSIPTIDHTSLNTFVESTGLRYIDGAAAVGADASGNWYADMLSSDGVHPSVLGAKAIAMRYLTDVPEIMQYGKSVSGAVTVKDPFYLTVTDNDGTITVDKTPAEIDALSADGYDVHMRLPMTLGQLTAVGDMRYFATLGQSAFYGIVQYGVAPLIAMARVKADKTVDYALVSVAVEDDIQRIESALIDKANASDVYTKTEINQKLVGAMVYKGTKETIADLPSSENETGDVWHINANGAEYGWNGTEWEELGTEIDFSVFAEKTWVQNQGYQTAQDVQTAFAGVRQLPTGGSTGDFLRKDSNGNAVWETIPTYQGGSY